MCNHNYQFTQTTILPTKTPPGKVFKRYEETCSRCSAKRFHYFLVDSPEVQAYFVIEQALVGALVRARNRRRNAQKPILAVLEGE